MRRRIFWVQCNRPLIFALSPGPVPIVIKFHVSQRRVRFGQRAIYLDCFGGGLLGQRKDVLRRTNALTAEEAVTVRQAGVGERVAWIFGDSLTEIVYRLLITLGRAFVPVEAPLQIKLIRLGICRVT